jgi:trehalose 6-phosphate synthase/phosphatase
MSKLLIVSNRMPISAKVEKGAVSVAKSAGGLATGMRGPHEQSQSLWIGWPGDVSKFDAGQREELERRMAELRMAPVYLSQAEVNRYYEGFSNGVLWPLFHYLTDKIKRDAWRDWKTYVEVNENFAEVVARSYEPGDKVWIHDYQLCLLPALVRKRVPHARIGFFLHIPFPSVEVFRILPWREHVLRGILGADLVGFHTHSYARHFAQSARHLLGLRGDGGVLEHGEREVRVDVFPMGVDAKSFAEKAEEPEVLDDVARLRAEAGGRKLLLGVDRLDYTKGIPRRMLAIERLLEREPSLRKKIRFVQVAVPSREKIDAYENYRRQLDEIVGRINGAYATVTAVPVHYMYRSVSEQQLVALYRAADVMLVTPLRDGMNLVAKEFIASRVDDDGVLVLSEFAGAAAELAEAVIVNPYDLDGMAVAIRRALDMTDDERRERMLALRRRVFGHDSYAWAQSFVDALEEPQHESDDAELPGEAQLKAIARAASDLLLILDYDGTLVPFAGLPQLAAPDARLLDLLGRLARRPHTKVHVVSGRDRQTLDRWLGALPVGLHAEHGYWSRTSPDVDWVPLRPEPAPWKPKALAVMEQFTASTPGSLVEEKTSTVAWHYRMVDPELGDERANEIWHRLAKELEGMDAEVLLGDKVVEARTKGIHKGIVATRLVGEAPPGAVALAIGDDRTDEDLFASLPPDGISVHVGSGRTAARYRLSDYAAVRAFLRGLLAADGS